MDLHILIPVPSHNIPNTPPPAALNGSPNELWEGEMIPHPVPPRSSQQINEVEEGGKGSGYLAYLIHDRRRGSRISWVCTRMRLRRTYCDRSSTKPLRRIDYTSGVTMTVRQSPCHGVTRKAGWNIHRVLTIHQLCPGQNEAVESLLVGHSVDSFLFVSSFIPV